MHEVKLSLETWSDPEQAPATDWAVIVDVSTAVLKVTEIVLLVATFVAASAGLVELTLKISGENAMPRNTAFVAAVATVETVPVIVAL